MCLVTYDSFGFFNFLPYRKLIVYGLHWLMVVICLFHNTQLNCYLKYLRLTTCVNSTVESKTIFKKFYRICLFIDGHFSNKLSRYYLTAITIEYDRKCNQYD